MLSSVSLQSLVHLLVYDASRVVGLPGLPVSAEKLAPLALAVSLVSIAPLVPAAASPVSCGSAGFAGDVCVPLAALLAATAAADFSSLI